MFKKLITKKSAFTYTLTIPRTFVAMSYIDIDIHTDAVMYIYKNIFGKYSFDIKIEQHVPYIEEPVYHGDEHTNAKLKQGAEISMAVVKRHINNNYDDYRIAFQKFISE